MLTREEIRAVYDQGPEAIVALGESLWALIEQQQAQIAELKRAQRGNRKTLADGAKPVIAGGGL